MYFAHTHYRNINVSHTRHTTRNTGILCFVSLYHNCIRTLTFFLKNIFLTAASPCLSSPCENNGICEATGDNYFCRCPDGFGGDHCEIESEEPPSGGLGKHDYLFLFFSGRRKLLFPKITFRSCSCFTETKWIIVIVVLVVLAVVVIVVTIVCVCKRKARYVSTGLC